MRSLSTTLLACSALWACGGSSDTTTPDAPGDGGGSSDGAAYTTFITSYATADCDRQLRCISPAPFDDTAACLAAIAPELTRARERIAASITAGHVAYDAPAAAACLALVESSCSTDVLDILLGCGSVTAGLLPVGGTCLAHFECAPAGADDRAYCFDGCTGLLGGEATAGAGECVDESPVGSPQCP